MLTIPCMWDANDYRCIACKVIPNIPLKLPMCLLGHMTSYIIRSIAALIVDLAAK